MILLKVKLACEDHMLPVGGILLFWVEGGRSVGGKGEFLCSSKMAKVNILSSFVSRETEAYRRLKYQCFAYNGDPEKETLGIYVSAMLLTPKASDSYVVAGSGRRCGLGA
jgi:hypothetical protein